MIDTIFVCVDVRFKVHAGHTEIHSNRIDTFSLLFCLITFANGEFRFHFLFFRLREKFSMTLHLSYVPTTIWTADQSTYSSESEMSINYCTYFSLHSYKYVLTSLDKNASSDMRESV